jgi:hypothetical protein
MPKTKVKIKRSECDLGGNVFGLISKAFTALENAGQLFLANEMSNRIDKEANSPADVRKIVEEYVTLV